MKIPSYLFNSKFSGIYCIENSITKKRYIGSTTFLYGRLHKHNSFLNSNKHQNIYLQNSWNKYGESNFECYSIEFCDKCDLKEREQHWIDLLEPEYNITLSVERNILSEESRKKISETLKRKYKSGEILSKSYKAVDVFDLDGNFIKTFRSLRETCEELNIHNSSVIRVLKNIYLQAKGYQFKYSGEDKIIEKIIKSKYLKNPVPLIKIGLNGETPEEDNPVLI